MNILIRKYPKGDGQSFPRDAAHRLNPQIEREICRQIVAEENAKIHRLNNGGLTELAKQTAALAEHNERAIRKGHKSGFQLVSSVPQELDQVLQDQQFDGSKKWKDNPDAVRYLKKRELSVLKMFPQLGKHI